jgi:hypothetical protein
MYLHAAKTVKCNRRLERPPTTELSKIRCLFRNKILISSVSDREMPTTYTQNFTYKEIRGIQEQVICALIYSFAIGAFIVHACQD